MNGCHIEEKYGLKHMYNGIPSAEDLCDKASCNIIEKTYEKNLQTFLSLSDDVPNIIVSKSTPNSPIISSKSRGNSMISTQMERVTKTEGPARKFSEGMILDNNFNKIHPKIERLCSGDKTRYGRMYRQASSCSMSSLCSVDTNCMSDVSDLDYDDLESSSGTLSNGEDTPTKKESMWVKLRKAVRWSPFMQDYKKQYPWIQLAGHQGGFKSGEQGTILKKSSKNEAECLPQLMNDVLQPFVPEFKSLVMEDDHTYIQMQDLLAEFEHPTFVMDCKMGTRTYLEEEVNKSGKPRQDLYMKMVSVDPSEPTDCENETCSCTKPRYMQWREQLSSTATLGFRIEGIKRGDNNPDKDFKKIKSEEDITCVFQRFIENRKDLQDLYIQRLKSIRNTLMASNFFQTHEIVGSSLLFIHDASGKSGIWLIDFGKTVPLVNGTVIDHHSEWFLGNHEDGYMFGLDNMINVWSNMRLEKI